MRVHLSSSLIARTNRDLPVCAKACPAIFHHTVVNTQVENSAKLTLISFLNSCQHLKLVHQVGRQEARAPHRMSSSGMTSSGKALECGGPEDVRLQFKNIKVAALPNKGLFQKEPYLSFEVEGGTKGRTLPAPNSEAPFWAEGVTILVPAHSELLDMLRATSMRGHRSLSTALDLQAPKTL